MRSISSILAALAILASACSGRAVSAPEPRPVASQAPAATEIPPTATLAPTVAPEPTATPPPAITRPAGEIVRGNPARAEMALTFDCGASGVPTPAILDALRAAGLRVTFFITGQWATTYPQLTRQIAAEHEVASHSWSHPDFRTLPDGQILAEMARAEEALNRIAGISTRPLWRAPFGARDARIMAVLRDAGWPYHIFWTADSGDWLDISPAAVRANVARAAANGAIIVQHCGSVQTAAILPEIIGDLTSRGFRLVTISELLRD